MSDIKTCPCGSGSAFADCCEPVISGARDAATAEELLRARYSAFATGAAEFIVATTHPSTKAKVDLAETREWAETSQWRGLEILETQPVSDDRAYVSFVALYTQHGKDVTHRERSLFERSDGRWFFVSGETLKNPTVRYETRPPGRNEPCPCGSGKKYKKCCGAVL